MKFGGKPPFYAAKLRILSDSAMKFGDKIKFLYTYSFWVYKRSVHYHIIDNGRSYFYK